MSKADDVAAELYALNSGGVPYGELSKRYQLTKGQISGAIDRYKDRLDKPTIHLGTPLHLTGDAVVVGDVHVPMTDWGLAGLVARVGEKTGIRRLIVAGDLVNMDKFSTYATAVKLPGWSDERDACRTLVHDWLETFNEIVFLMGNHDRRLEKWSDGEFSDLDIFGLLTDNNPKCKFSNFGWCTINSGGVPWRITHPSGYRQNQLVLADQLANKYSSNIWSFHEHHFGVGWDKWGRWVIVNGGGLEDPALLPYAVLDDNAMPGMVQGFGILQDGCPTLYGKAPFTDWGRALT